MAGKQAGVREGKPSRTPFRTNPKPEACRLCPMYEAGFGFVPDHAPCPLEECLFGIICEAPGETESYLGKPLVGKTGRFLDQAFLAQIGVPRERVWTGNAIRCRPKDNQFPMGKTADKAIQFCRSHDTLLDLWNPDVGIVTYHPAAVFRSRAYYVLILRALELARIMASKGLRPVVLMGEKAVRAFAPEFESLRSWHRHYFRWIRKGGDQ